MATNNGKTTTATATAAPSKSEAWNKATGQATKEDGTTDTMVLSPDQKLMISMVDDAAINDAMNDSSMEWAPEILRLKENQKIQGVLEGNGPPAEFRKTEGGVEKVNVVKTWIIASPNGSARVSILSSSQLDKALPPLVGGLVTIIRRGEQNLAGGHRVTLYSVGGQRRADGVRRSWALPVVIDAHAIEAAKPAAELTAGHPEGEDVSY